CAYRTLLPLRKRLSHWITGRGAPSGTHSIGRPAPGANSTFQLLDIPSRSWYTPFWQVLGRRAEGLPADNSIPATIGVWLSLVERCVRVAEVGGSNPLTPIFCCTPPKEGVGRWALGAGALHPKA